MATTDPNAEARELVADLKRLGLVTQTGDGQYRLRSRGRCVRDFLNQVAAQRDDLVPHDPRRVREGATR